MKRYHIFLLAIALTFYSCNKQKSTHLSFNTMADLLTQIESDKNIELLENSLDDEIILFIPDAPPIYSKDVVIDLFQFLWKRNETKSNIKYSLETKTKKDSIIIENGIYSTTNDKNSEEKMPFTVSGYRDKGQFKITEITYDNSKKTIIELPKPTGKYNIGQSTHFYENNYDTLRPLAFQIWYPTLEDSEIKIPFQSKNIAEAISHFLGWPSFNNSFTRLIKSNSIKNVPIVSNNKFPVLIYNHGYGGATSVYQTIFEELASHGYIVVSIGHQDESAFMLKEDGTIVQNSPDNEFYAKRAPEISNRIVGVEQSIILNSDDVNAQTKAYKRLVDLTPLHTESVNLWVLDIENVIQKLKEINKQDKYLKGGFDFDNMGVFGHSVGGATAGDFASKTIFKAGINLDGFQFGNLINNKLEIPFLFVSSNEEGERFLRVEPFAKIATKEVYHAVIKGFSHSSFSDLQLFSPKGGNDIQLQRKLILGFFNKYLKHKENCFELANDQYQNLRINKLK